MDILLQIADTYVFDQLYAKVFPINNLDVDSAVRLVQNKETLSPLGVLGKHANYTSISAYVPLTPSKHAYLSRVPRENVWRQFFNLYMITLVFALIFYFSIATLFYIFLYDKSSFKHPKYRKDQIRREIKESLYSIPFMTLFTIPIFMLDVHGYSMLYETNGPGLWYEFLQFPWFVVFTDFGNYWIHRVLHLPWVYKTIHKQHHQWVIATPFSGYAFNPIDGWALSIPYHIFIFVFPMNKWQYLATFVWVNVWTVLIHEGQWNDASEIIYSPGCHHVHHIRFCYNYGQFFTLWDHLAGTYRNPKAEVTSEELAYTGKHVAAKASGNAKHDQNVVSNELRERRGKQAKEQKVT